MKRYFKLFTLSIVMLGLIFVVGCGGDKPADTQQPTDQPAAEEPTAQDVPTYKVGTDAAYAPFESVDPQGNIVGFDMDVLSAIAEAEGFKVEFVNTAWEGIIPSLVEGRNDIVISAMTITDERKKEVDFSDPYFESTNYIAVPKDSSVAAMADLKGKKVSVQQGTTGDVALSEFLGENYDGIKRFKGTPEAFLELKNGKVDAAVADSGVVMEYVKNNPDLNLKYIVDETFEKENYGIAIKKENTELLEKINNGLKTIKENGKYDEVYQKWFGSKPQ